MDKIRACLLLLVLTLALATKGFAEPWKSLKVKYALTGFYNMPTSISEIKKDYSKYYFYVNLDTNLNCTLYSYHNDPRVMILFDFHGNIAGLRTCYIKKDVAKRAESKHLKFPYRFEDIPMFSNENYWGVDCWCTSVLFLSPDKLRAGGRPESSGEVTWSEVWVKLNGTYVSISKDECQVEKQGFTKQNCFVGMGKHYFFNMTSDLDCATWPPVFLLYEGGELIGLGIIPVGSFTSTDREWFEDPGTRVVKAIIPNRPDCLLDYVENYGTSGLHIFFKKHPALTFCLGSDPCSK